MNENSSPSLEKIPLRDENRIMWSKAFRPPFFFSERKAFVELEVISVFSIKKIPPRVALGSKT